MLGSFVGVCPARSGGVAPSFFRIVSPDPQAAYFAAKQASAME